MQFEGVQEQGAGQQMLIGVDASRATHAQRTGTETYSAELVRRLPDFLHGHRLRFYAHTPPDDDLLLATHSAEWRVMPFPRLWTHVRLSLEMALEAPDVLFVPAHVIPLAHPERCVVTVHDLGYLAYPQTHPLFSRWYLTLSTRWNVQVASHVIADSEATRRDLHDRLNVNPAKVSVVYPGYDEQRFQPVRDEQRIEKAREKYGIRERYVLFLGTVQPRKNLTRLVEAFAQTGDPTTQLVIAGRRGWLTGDLYRHAKTLALGERVCFPGYIAAEDVPALLTGATLFAFPSLYEGFGLPVLEAMACGTPVLCSNAASLPEVAGDAALLTDPHDTDSLGLALQRLLQDETLRRDLIARGLARARRFSWDSSARQIAGIIGQIAAQ